MVIFAKVGKEVGSTKLEVRSWKYEVGSTKLEVRSKKSIKKLYQ